MKHLNGIIGMIAFACMLMVSTSCSKDEAQNIYRDNVYEGKIMEHPINVDGKMTCVVTKSPLAEKEAMNAKLPYPGFCRIIFNSDAFQNVSLKPNMVVTFELLHCQRNPDQHYMDCIEYLGTVKPIAVAFEPNNETEGVVDNELYEGRIINDGAGDEVCCIVTKAPLAQKVAVAANKPFAGECYVYFSSKAFTDVTLKKDMVITFNLLSCQPSDKHQSKNAVNYDCKVKPISIIY